MKLLHNCGKLHGVLWIQCDPSVKNKIQLVLRYGEVPDMLNAFGLLGIVEKICLLNEISKYYALQFHCTKKIAKKSFADSFKEFEMLTRITHEASADIVTMENLEQESTEAYTITQTEFLTDKKS